MPEIEIRSAIATDIPYLLKINHNFTSERVWQMEIQREDNHLEIVFREVKLPRSVQVSYPVDFHTLPDLWNQRSVILVAVIDGAPIGYIGLMENLSPKSVWVSDFAIEPKHRTRRWHGINVECKGLGEKTQRKMSGYADSTQELSCHLFCL